MESVKGYFAFCCISLFSYSFLSWKLKQQEENLHAEKEQAVAQEEERQLQNIVNQQRLL